MDTRRFWTQFLSFAFPAIAVLCAMIILATMFTQTLAIALALCILVAAGGSLVIAVSLRREEAVLARDFGDVLTKLAKQLGHGLSAFASGDLRFRLRKPAVEATSPEAAALAKRLLSCVDDFNSITNVPLKRVCFVGANGYEEGKVAGEHIGEMLGGKGKVGYMIPSFSQTNHVLRMKGCHDYLSEHYLQIVNLPVIETNGDPAFALEKGLALVSDNPDLSLLYITDGWSPGALAEGFAKAGLSRVKIVAYDTTNGNIDRLKKGLFTALIEQNPTIQTHNAIVHLYNAREASWVPLSRKLFMAPIYVDQSNYRNYWDDERNERIMRDEERSLMVAPVPSKSGKRYRIGVILPTVTGFFETLVAGVEAAKASLAEHNVEIELVNVFHTQFDFGAASLVVPVIESFVKRGYDGFALSVIDPDTMPAINAAVDAGLTVTTFSTEPSSFREIIMTVMDNMGRLSESSQTLAAAAEQSARANGQIGQAILGIREDIGEQKKRLSANEGELATLNGMISGMERSFDAYSKLVSAMTGESAHGSGSMDETWRETQALKEAIDRIGAELAAFNEKLAKVREFAAVIESISESTNVLAINASIQAARAGTAGKAFAVVAGEVRGLAENSRNTAESIRDIVAGITDDMAKIMDVSSRGAERVGKNLSDALVARESFESIARSLAESSRSVDSIRESVSGLARLGSDVKANMDAVERMADATKNRIEEISVSINELSEQGGHLSRTANDLRVMASDQSLVFSQLSVNEASKG